MKLESVKDMVLSLLERYKIAQKDDYILYLLVLRELGINTKLPIQELFLNSKEYRLPSFKSVERSRRGIQRIRPDLKDKKTAIIRENEQEKFINLNRNMGG